MKSLMLLSSFTWNVFKWDWDKNFTGNFVLLIFLMMPCLLGFSILMGVISMARNRERIQKEKAPKTGLTSNDVGKICACILLATVLIIFFGFIFMVMAGVV